jgi:NitT/TauT family transport system ATP-binding protein
VIEPGSPDGTQAPPSLETAGEVIRVERVSKLYRRTMPGDRLRTLKSALVGRSLTRGLRPEEAIAALHEVDFTVRQGEAFGLIGGNGSGKSTLLKLVAGLLDVSRGVIELDGVPKARGVPPDVGLVFQNDALLPWRTVADNVRLPLVGGRRSGADQHQRVAELLELVNLSRFAGYFPRQLSGGMRKRVALARTLAYDPEVFLMDEPFGPLDAQTRIRLGGEFLNIWETVGKSVFFVTHDVEEAIALSDRVVVMSAAPGTIKAEFTIDLPRPRDFYEVRFETRFKELHRDIWASLSEEHGTAE